MEQVNEAAPVSNEDLTPEERYASVLNPIIEQYGKSKIAYWEVPDFGLLVAAKPKDPLEYSKLVNELKQEEVDANQAITSFALKCVLFPDAQTTKKIFKEYPAFALKVGKRGQELCGSNFKELGKG